jgi:D-alanyl-D-alanine carboxypeptidase
VEVPSHANQISACPGHSEHKLGTVVDFSSAEMFSLTGNAAEKLSSLFDSTYEGIWLTNHAFKYGFIMSSPPSVKSLPDLSCEPWHYLYAGEDLALFLHLSGFYLYEYLLKIHPIMPCIP